MLDDLDRYTGALDGYTELRLHTNHQVNLFMRKGTLLENARTRSGGVSARCWHGGAFGFASQAADDPAAIKRVIGEASANAALVRTRTDATLPSSAPGTGTFDYRSTRSALSHAERLERLRAIDDYISSRYPDLVNRDLILSTLAMEKALITSEGARTYSYVPRTILVVRLSAQASDGVVELHQDYGGFGDFEDQFDDISSVFPAIDRLHEAVRAKADGVQPRAGVHDVILDSDVAGILAHEAIGHTCEADLVMGGSVAGENLGRQVASEKFTLTDYAGRGPGDNGSIAIHVDDEGTPCRDTTLIENGVLSGFLTNKETALALGLEPTGNARAFTFADEPLVRMRNTVIEPGNDRLQDMIGTIEHGYYLKRSANGQADLTGEFMFGIAEGYEINNGRLGQAIRDTTISGVAFDMLKSITHVSDDLTWARGGMCGKKQLMPVGMAGPAIKCRITMGGR